MNRQEYIDDYGLGVDPLFNMIDELEKENAELKQSNERLKQALHEANEATNKVVDAAKSIFNNPAAEFDTSLHLLRILRNNIEAMEALKMEDETLGEKEVNVKEQILGRLHDLVGIKNVNGVASTLPETLGVNDVLEAINLDNK